MREKRRRRDNTQQEALLICMRTRTDYSHATGPRTDTPSKLSNLPRPKSTNQTQTFLTRKQNHASNSNFPKTQATQTFRRRKQLKPSEDTSNSTLPKTQATQTFRRRKQLKPCTLRDPVDGRGVPENQNNQTFRTLRPSLRARRSRRWDLRRDNNNHGFCHLQS